MTLLKTSKRLSLSLSLVATLALGAQASEKNADILFVKLHYGSELAANLSEYLENHATF